MAELLAWIQKIKKKKGGKNNINSPAPPICINHRTLKIYFPRNLLQFYLDFQIRGRIID